MGKRCIPLFVLLALILCLAGNALAQTKTIVVKAYVPDKPLSLTAVIRAFTDGNPDNNPWTSSSETSSMDFGTLTNLLTDGSNAGVFYSTSGFCVILYPTAFGKPYQITSTCTGITSGSNSFPAGAFGVTPVYSADDKLDPTGTETQGTMPAGATLGSAGTAITSNKLIYSSESVNAGDRIIQAYYGISPKKADGSLPFSGWTGVPLTQMTGQYSGNVQITIASKS